MIDKAWGIEQIKRKWRTYQQLKRENMRLSREWHLAQGVGSYRVDPDGQARDEAVRAAHRDYSRTMYPIKEFLGMRHSELVALLRDVERELDSE